VTNTSTPALPALSFGIGCFSFEVPDADLHDFHNPKGSYSLVDFKKDLEEALSSIPSLDNIDVSDFNTTRLGRKASWRNEIEQSLHDFPHEGNHRGGDLKPQLSAGFISFTITIPIHTQKKVFAFGHPMPGTNFEVDIRFGGGMPVAFVRAPEGSLRPSMAVAIVREFLESEFEQRINAISPIRFTSMGPSPMWNDCFMIRSGKALSAPIEVTSVETHGYQQIAFLFDDASSSDSVEERYEELKDAVADELSYYYELVSRRNVVGIQRSFIEHELEQLVEIHRRSGLRAWFKRVFGGGRRANDLMLDILAAKSEISYAFRGARSEWERLRGLSPIHAFDHSFEAELGSPDDGDDDAGEVENIVSLLTERHSRDVQLVSVIVSSVLGGLVGAAITALVGLLSSSGGT